MEWFEKTIDAKFVVYESTNAILIRLGNHKFWHPAKMTTPQPFGDKTIRFNSEWEFRDADTKELIPYERMMELLDNPAKHHVPDKMDPVKVTVDASLLHG